MVDWINVVFLLSILWIIFSRKDTQILKAKKWRNLEKFLTTQLLKLQEADSLHKELVRELQKGLKKEDINWAVLKNLQKLSFSARRESIQEMTGTKVLNQILEKYPFLGNKRIVSEIFLNPLITFH